MLLFCLHSSAAFQAAFQFSVTGTTDTLSDSLLILVPNKVLHDIVSIDKQDRSSQFELWVILCYLCPFASCCSAAYYAMAHVGVEILLA